MKREVVVSSVGFGEEGVEISYLMLPDDVRSGGHIVSSRNISVSYQAPDGFGTRVDTLRLQLHELMSELHDAIPAMDVYEGPKPTAIQAGTPDDDEDAGMGDG